jgi:para-nitrobenzyl esterase
MAIVDTKYGKLEGTEDGGLHVFKDIHYATPPVGDKRWLAPEPPAPWTGVRNATQWNTQAWQGAASGTGATSVFFLAADNPKRNEDCLVLNVFTPGVDDAKRPVLVWIHGGGFGGGTGCTPAYSGANVARRGDVVVVTINYRVGVLGFLNLSEITKGRIPSTGNEGLLDQVMALQWVQDNISAFGGDAGNVTIYGESAGGMSVGALMAFEPARGLFHRASPISGAGSCCILRDRAVDVSDRFMKALDLSPKDDIDKLLAMHPEDLMAAAGKVRTPNGGMIFSPVVDGTQLPDIPLECIRNGSADGISVLTGTTRDEWRLFIAQTPATEDENELIAELGKHVDRPEELFAGYKDLRGKAGADTDPISIYAAIETARKMWWPCIKLCEAMGARGQDAYQYLFTWPSPYTMANGKPLAMSHAVVCGYIFGTYNINDDAVGFFGSGEAADTLAGHVMDTWINFARTGNPQTEALSNWASYDSQTRTTAILGDPAEIVNAPFEEERALWEGRDQTALPLGPARDVA